MVHIEFPPENTSQKSDEYLRLVKTGVIDTISIGFDPHKAEPLPRTVGASGSPTGRCWKSFRLCAGEAECSGHSQCQQGRHQLR